MKLILTGITLAMLALSAQAQSSDKAPVKPSAITSTVTPEVENRGAFHEHQVLVRSLRAKKAKTIEMAFQASTASKVEFFYWAQRYWLTANERMASSGAIFTYLPENDPLILTNFVRSQHYDWLYVLPNIAVIAQEHGYIPNCYLTLSVEAVIVVPTDVPYKSTQDLKNKNIGINAGSNDSRLTKYALHLEEIPVKYTEVNEGTSELTTQFENKKFDAVSLRKDEADKLMKDKPGKFRILATSPEKIPGAVMLAHSRVPQDEVDMVTKACVNTSRDIVVKSGANVPPNVIKPFEAYEKDHLRLMRAAMGHTDVHYSRNIFNPKTNMFTDLHEVFTEPPKKGTYFMKVVDYQPAEKPMPAKTTETQPSNGTSVMPEIKNVDIAPKASEAKASSPAAPMTSIASAPKPVEPPKAEVKTDAPKAK